MIIDKGNFYLKVCKEGKLKTNLHCLPGFFRIVLHGWAIEFRAGHYKKNIPRIEKEWAEGRYTVILAGDRVFPIGRLEDVE